MNSDKLPPELRAINALMNSVFGAINAAGQTPVAVPAEALTARDGIATPAPAAPLDGSDGVVERGPVRSTKPEFRRVPDVIAKLESDRAKLVEALRELMVRCDGAEGVRADGSNIQTMRASALLAELGELE